MCKFKVYIVHFIFFSFLFFEYWEARIFPVEGCFVYHYIFISANVCMWPSRAGVVVFTMYFPFRNVTSKLSFKICNMYLGSAISGSCHLSRLPTISWLYCQVNQFISIQTVSLWTEHNQMEEWNHTVNDTWRMYHFCDWFALHNSTAIPL